MEEHGWRRYLELFRCTFRRDGPVEYRSIESTDFNRRPLSERRWRTNMDGNECFASDSNCLRAVGDEHCLRDRADQLRCISGEVSSRWQNAGFPDILRWHGER